MKILPKHNTNTGPLLCNESIEIIDIGCGCGYPLKCFKIDQYVRCPICHTLRENPNYKEKD